jgi:hypothetical protein
MKKTAPGKLTPHPDLAGIPMIPDVIANLETACAESKGGNIHLQDALSSEREKWAAFLKTIEDDDVLEPVKVIKDTNFICDGRHRWAGSVAAGKEDILFEEVTKEQARVIITATLTGKRHYTTSAMAYNAVATHPQIANKKQGQRSDLATSLLSREVAKTNSALAAEFGVGLATLENAIFCYREIQKLKNSKAKKNQRAASQFEALIYTGTGIGKVKQMIQSITSKPGDKEKVTPSKAAPDKRQLALSTWKPIVHLLDSKLNSETALEDLRETLAYLPEVSKEPGEISLASIEGTFKRQLEEIEAFKRKLKETRAKEKAAA